ncbi:MAG: 4'-phosphopantetheinyl transferase superfamily protein [Clostridiales bacterium]|nr:4'-phosphopantetheinyl transferase superfamily protein [Clostridiales bacterium]
MELYVFENYKSLYPELTGKELTDRLALCALEEYGADDAVIARTYKGKPYVLNHQDIYFSVSHSGGFFVCLIGDTPLGVDIQKRSKTNIDGIIKRYFTEGEREYIEERGDSAFFTLWARKEAYAKYTGEGLQAILAKAPVLNRKDVEFFDFQLERDLYGSWCSI